jgi:hypothetical protein
MTSKIKVDNVNKVSDDSNIIKKCGTTITLGASGDSIALASGASQSGFGRTGTVDWQTSIKTAATFTAVNGEGYFVDTSSNAITATLPAGTAGSIVAFRDYANNFATNALTIAADGSQKIENNTEDYTISINSESLTLVYANDTKGWLVVNDANKDAGNSAGFITATGGTITTVCTNFKVHTFTGPGTFCVSAGGGPQAVAGYLVVAGGGAAPNTHGSGSGAGGYREGKSDPVTGPYTGSPLAACASIQFAPGAFEVVVGGGGSNSPGPTGGSSGSNSVLNYTGSTITSAGGGKGRAGAVGCAGGSGGGGGATGGPPVNPGGAGNTPPVSPSQGFPGGTGGGGPGAQGDVSGGGGGATEAGVNGNAPGTASGRGGAGTSTSISASPVAYAGGGGGGGRPPNGTCNGAASPCGTGGAANAGDNAAQPTRNGLANRGGGGAGGVCSGTCAGSGGSGVVIIRYKFQ